MSALHSESTLILSANDFTLVISPSFILSSIKHYDILNGACVCINDKIAGSCRQIEIPWLMLIFYITGANIH